jgi:hypothetical protein
LRAFFGIVTYDEVHFLSIAVLNSGMFGNWGISNFEGFGIIFWTMYTFLAFGVGFFTNSSENFRFIENGFDQTRFFDYTNVFGPPHLTIISLRVIAILLSLAFILKLYSMIQDSSNVNTDNKAKLWNYGILTIVVVSPIYWWAGKLASPEYFATYLAGFGVICLIKNWTKKSLLYFALAASFKLSVLPIVLGIFLSQAFSIFRGQRLGLPRRAESVFSLFKTNLKWFILPFLGLNVNLVLANQDYLRRLPDAKFNTQIFTDFEILATTFTAFKRHKSV